MQMLLEIWPTWVDLARDLGVPYPTVTSWHRRGLPPRRIPDIIIAARARGRELTYEGLLPLTVPQVVPEDRAAAAAPEKKQPDPDAGNDLPATVQRAADSDVPRAGRAPFPKADAA